MIFESDSLNTALALQLVTMTGILLYLRKKNEPPPKKLHVDYGPSPPAPLPLKIIGSLPDWIRIPMLAKGAKPKPPKDSIDVLGTNDVDPYKKWEVLPGKIWGVKYSYLADLEFAKVIESIVGFQMEDREETTIARAPEHMKEILTEDFALFKKKKDMSDEERARSGGDSAQTMYISKITIDGEDNSLVLYNPVRLHPHILEWISELGKVKFIVGGSSSHTNHMPDTANLFPEAKIICASAADLKCQAAGMRPADYLCDIRRDDVKDRPKLAGRGTLEDASEALKGQATLFHVRGDVVTQALFFLVHKHMFEIDLIYIPSEKTIKEEELETSKEMMKSGYRVFQYCLLTKDEPPLGYLLPNYRCLMLDPTSALSKVLIDPPKADGSSCVEMAESLRSILKKIREPGVCEGVHSGHSNSFALEEFCTRLDETWGWLDGKSLLE